MLIIKIIRKIFGISYIVHLINNLTDILNKVHYSINLLQDAVHRNNEKSLKQLEKNDYSTLLMPLDYPPSYNYEPRWGYSKEKISILDSLFSKFNDSYLDDLMQMKNLKPKSISKFSQKKLEAAFVGGAINAFDILLLYHFVKKINPSKFIEIGSGMTTFICKAAIKDFDLKTTITTIDPNPRMDIEKISDDIFYDALENIDLSVFDNLSEGDILFFDGSHRTFMNSDVTVFFIDVLPRIKPGVIIHLHDIFLPYDYPLFFKNFYWNEQYMLAVYLLQSKGDIEILFPSYFVTHSDEFKKIISDGFIDLGKRYNPLFKDGGSFWFKKK